MTDSNAVVAGPLGESDTQLTLLIDGVVDYAIYMLDPNGHIVTWNAGASRIKGYTQDEIVGQHVARFYVQEDRDADIPNANLARAGQHGRLDTEGWRVRKDGSRFWAHVVIDRITDGDGQLLGFAKVTRDVTDQRNARQALDDAKEALFHAQKLEALGKLTGGVAHDFNNLLMAMQGALDLIQLRAGNDERIANLVRIATASVERGSSLTKRMLGFARRQALQPTAVEPAVLLYEMLDLLRATAGPSIDVAAQVAPHVPPVYVDPHQLELALINLVVNARDALPHGGHITLAADAVEAQHPSHAPTPTRYICLSITDDGTGMDAATLARATDPFFTTKEVGKGTGLGLPTVDGFAAQSGGWLNLRSKPGQGTRVELYLPIMADAAGDVSAAVDAPNDVASLRILLVDDEPLVHQMVAALLEDLGHTVVSAHRGQQALDLLESGVACDVLMTDFAMPGLTGGELAQAARVLRPNLPVILASGYAEMEAGDMPWLVRVNKPFDRHRLVAALRQAVPGTPLGTKVTDVRADQRDGQ